MLPIYRSRYTDFGDRIVTGNDGEFNVGETAIYSRPGSPHHGTEVIIDSDVMVHAEAGKEYPGDGRVHECIWPDGTRHASAVQNLVHKDLGRPGLI